MHCERKKFRGHVESNVLGILLTIACSRATYMQIKLFQGLDFIERSVFFLHYV